MRNMQGTKVTGFLLAVIGAMVIGSLGMNAVILYKLDGRAGDLARQLKDHQEALQVGPEVIQGQVGPTDRQKELALRRAEEKEGVKLRGPAATRQAERGLRRPRVTRALQRAERDLERRSQGLGAELGDGTSPEQSETTCFGEPATIVGTPGNDNLIGTANNDVIVGLAGDDFIDGLGRDDKLCGGDGDDRLFGKEGDDELSGGAGNDLLNGGTDDDNDSDNCDGGPGVDEADDCEAVTGVP